MRTAQRLATQKIYGRKSICGKFGFTGDLGTSINAGHGVADDAQRGLQGS
jgi:hypothetical protein